MVMAVLYSLKLQSATPSLIVSPMFKMFGGGMGNMVSAPFLTRNQIDFVGRSGASKIVIDIGVLDGAEAAQAVTKGFTVFSFEPISESITRILQTFEARNLSDRVKLINLTHSLENDFDWDLSKFQRSLTKEYALEHFPLSQIGGDSHLGFCYLFQAAASDDFQVLKMMNSGAMTDMSNTAPGAGKGAPSTVVTVPISSFIYQDVFWLKSDTQGHELSVLRGAVDLFQNYRVHSLTIEFWPIVLQKMYGKNGVNDLMVHMEQELGLRICFLSRTDQFSLLFDRSVTIPEFVEMSLKVADEQDNGNNNIGFWDDLTCF